MTLGPDCIIMPGMKVNLNVGLIRKRDIRLISGGRSIGWWFMALVDALDYIPENHPGRADMIGWIQGLAETLPKVSGQEWLVVSGY